MNLRPARSTERVLGQGYKRNLFLEGISTTGTAMCFSTSSEELSSGVGLLLLSGGTLALTVHGLNLTLSTESRNHFL